MASPPAIAKGAAAAAGAESPDDYDPTLAHATTNGYVYKRFVGNTLVLAIYAPKGGVGKTTTALTIASCLAARGLRVLLIDTDQQQSLSQYALSAKLSTSASASPAPLTYEQFRETLPKFHTFVDAAYAIRPAVADTPVQGLYAPYAVQLGTYARGGELRLLMSDFRQTALEELFADSQTLADVPSAHSAANNLGAPINVVQMTAAYWNSDVVVLDMSPAATAFNRTLLMCTDFFLVPAFDDSFSEYAIKALAKNLVKEKSINVGFLARFDQCVETQQRWLRYITHLLPEQSTAKCLGVYLTESSAASSSAATSAVERAAAVLYESLGAEHRVALGAEESASSLPSFIFHRMPRYSSHLKTLAESRGIAAPMLEASELDAADCSAAIQELQVIKQRAEELTTKLLTTLLRELSTPTLSSPLRDRAAIVARLTQAQRLSSQRNDAEVDLVATARKSHLATLRSIAAELEAPQQTTVNPTQRPAKRARQ